MAGLKERLGTMAPRFLVRAYRRWATAVEFVHDYQAYTRSTLWRFGSGRSARGQDSRECLEARLALAYHGIEKGASFAHPKSRYGERRVAQIRELTEIAGRMRVDSQSVVDAQSAVTAVEEFNRSGAISDEVTPISDWDGRRYPEDEIWRFVRTRHSVRDYSSASVGIDLIREIVRQASTTPSVCNRRPYRAYYTDDPAKIRAILALQNGNRGFGDSVPGVFMVTVRRSSYIGARERNQRWIDGGLFAMSLVWLCHAHGLATCFLNWSETNRQSRKLRDVTGIPPSEDVVTLVAVGYGSAGHRVARSPLRPEGDTFVYWRGGVGPIS